MERRNFLRLIALTGTLPTVTKTDRGISLSSDSDEWCVFGYDLRNSSYRNGISGPTTGAETNWGYDTGGPILSSPAVADGFVYVGSRDGKMYSLSSESGDLHWSFETGKRKPVYGWGSGAGFPEDGGVESSPCIYDGKLYFGAYDGKLYCLDSGTGEAEWEYETDSIIRSSPVVVDGRVYIGDWTGKMRSLDTETGDENWVYETGYDHVYSTPCYTNEVLYFGSAKFDDGDGNTGGLHSVDAETGEERWVNEYDDVVGSSPVFVDVSPTGEGVGFSENGVVCFGCFDGNVYAVNSDDGGEVWGYTAERGFGASPASDGESLYIAGNDGRIYSFDVNSGRLNWWYETGQRFYASNLSSTDQAVYVGGHDHSMYALRSEDGTPLWRFGTSGDIRSMPAVFDDRIYFGSQDGTVYCLSEAEGSTGTDNHGEPRAPTFVEGNRLQEVLQLVRRLLGW